MNITKIKNTIIKCNKLSLSSSGVFIGRVIVKNCDGIFPLVTFNRFTSIISKCKSSDVIDVEGVLKDYCYSDYNGVSHYVKLIVVTSLTVNGVCTSVENNEKEEFEHIWENIKGHYQVIDVLEFERISRKEGVLN